MMPAVIEMKNTSKSFPGIKANDQVNLTLYQGEIHALLGENGAGKSTLMSILTGNYRPDEGEIYFRGAVTNLKKPKDAKDLGIGMVHQHFRLVETLSVAENIVLACRQKGLMIKMAEVQNSIVAHAQQYGLDIDPAAKIWQLSIGEQQRVEIIKLLYQGTEVIILDEPTAVLTPQETRSFFTNLATMAKMGKTIVFITHKLHEVMEYSNRITVMRAGKSVATMLTKDTNKETLTHLMVGRQIEHSVNQNVFEGAGSPVLELDKINADNEKGLPALIDVDLQIHPGEILCIAGVAGNGQRELGEVISGLRKIKSGQLALCGKTVTDCNPKQMIRHGVAFVPEDRLGMGLVPKLNVYRNLILKDYDTPGSSRLGVIKEKEIEQRAARIMDSFNVLSAGAQRAVGLMSGGNQQKLLLAREVEKDPVLIVATYPARGLDIGAVEVIHRVFLEQKEKGAAILLISEDLEEIFAIADRIAVLHEGRVMGVVKRSEASYESVGRLMLGNVREEA